MRLFLFVLLAFCLVDVILWGTGAGATPANHPFQQQAESLILSSIFVSRIVFSGETVLPEEELRGLISSYEGRRVTFQELEDLRQALNSRFLERGYVNSGVTLEDQQVHDGVVTLTVIHGKLTEITIHNNRFFHASYLRERLARDVLSPLNVNTLQRNLQLLQQDPRIKTINAELRPGLAQGEGVLEVTVVENPSFSAGVTVDNGKSPAIGDLHGEVTMTRQNLLGRGDSWQGSYGMTDGESSEYSLTASVPVTLSDTLLKIHTSRTDTVLVEEPFQSLDIRNTSSLWRFSMTHPFWRQPSGEFRVGAALDSKENEASLLGGRPFTYFSGMDQGRSHLIIWRLSQEFVLRGADRVMALSSSLNSGENRSFSGDLGDGVDKRFFSWMIQGKMLSAHRVLHRETQVVVRTDCQLTGDTLLPSERFSMGGMQSVRGYRENSVMRDNGLFGSLEWRIPVAATQGQGELSTHIVPFIDGAMGWNSDTAFENRKGLASAGVGLHLAKAGWFECLLFYGVPFGHDGANGNSLQDRGFHLRMSLSLL